MTVYRWEPRKDFEVASQKLRRLFNDVEGAITNGIQQGIHVELGTFAPRVDISESKENVYVRAELPGMTAEDVKITLSEGALTLRGEKKRTEESKQESFHRIERSHGEFVRQFALPANLNEDAIEANFIDGVLEIRIPKREPEKPREREVKIGK
ncbi:MAG: Hsp20/alpha crystallin family protein [Bacteroidota bacterium]|nr:Hsp20/alpha crystallin family protein [Bacteroidota bacterium]MDP4231830.1 Hsp20/alpha crystallin family protein [Bacteroidota bacterium]MDP4242716.1 Hsp20/alpha crystallin family protein [Bacteroidota bacterium]MDP4287167.1 Hsp20/alpha crystallin family protein [Bacteroidota bacterium]